MNIGNPCQVPWIAGVCAFIASALIAVIVSTAAPAMAQPQGKPNIVYILVDNWGWGDISIQGSSVSTPRIDNFAKQGGDSVRSQEKHAEVSQYQTGPRF